MERVFTYSFHKIYPLYLQKVTKKGRTKEELDQILTWFFACTLEELNQLTENQLTLQALFESRILPKEAEKITGVVCGVRVETIEDPLLKKIRLMDKIVDELAKGKDLTKIKRIGK